MWAFSAFWNWNWWSRSDQQRLDRKFFYSYQLNDFIGKKLKIKLKDKINEKKTFKAVLNSVDDDFLELNVGKEKLTVDFRKIDMFKMQS